MTNENSIQAVLQFWFGQPDSDAASYTQRRKIWFGKQTDLDALITQQFRLLYESAVAGKSQDWQQTPESCLALIIVLDQFSRNMFRDSPKAFAADPQALQVAKFAVDQGFDRQLVPIQRIFMYLPFEHSENLEQQARSVELFHQLQTEAPELADTYDYALRHQAVIQQFGRFPHRNAILGRSSTAAEKEFLQQPGSSF